MSEPDLRGHYEFRGDTELADTCGSFGSPMILLSFSVGRPFSEAGADPVLFAGSDEGSWPSFLVDPAATPPVFPLRGSYTPSTGTWGLGVSYYGYAGCLITTGVSVEDDAGFSSGVGATWVYMRECSSTLTSCYTCSSTACYTCPTTSCYVEVAGLVYWN